MLVQKECSIYWPFMAKDRENYVTQKCSCIKAKKPTMHVRAPMGSVTSSFPFELVCINWLPSNVRCGGYKYILLVIDHLIEICSGISHKE